jgi:hypothetical protein
MCQTCERGYLVLIRMATSPEVEGRVHGVVSVFGARDLETEEEKEVMRVASAFLTSEIDGHDMAVTPDGHIVHRANSE